MMIGDGIEDEEKWLAAGIAGLQQNAFYTHRALVTVFNFFSGSQFLTRFAPIENSRETLIFVHRDLDFFFFECCIVSGLQQSPRLPQIFCSDALRASNLEAFSSQIL